jgi:hypothetical protein
MIAAIPYLSIAAFLGVSAWGLISLCSVEYKIHVSMTKERTNKWGHGNWSDFMREFNKREWERDKRHPQSFFEKGSRDGRIHASIVCFGGRGMVLDRKSFRKMKRFIKKNELLINPNVNWKA